MTDSTSTPIKSRKALWHAAGLAQAALERARRFHAQEDQDAVLAEYFRLTHYYARTLMLSREGFQNRDERLIVATLSNLLILDKALGDLHKLDPVIVPMALPLTESFHDRFVRGLISRILRDAQSSLRIDEIQSRLWEYKLLGEIDADDVLARLKELTAARTIERTDDGYSYDNGTPLELSAGNAVLSALVGTDLAASMGRYDFDTPESILARRLEFRKQFSAVSGIREEIVVLLVEVLFAFVDEAAAMGYDWRHRDIIHSGMPRPYQLMAYAVFRGHGYENVVIEAPTGSGKTLIGMMCIQDWLRYLTPGESILVLVPTINYQQQWVKELCYSDIGLAIAPELVYAGTPEGLEKHLKRTDEVPPIIVMTYLGMTSIHDDDAENLNRFFRTCNLKFCILDEVHKAAGDTISDSASVVRSLAGACRENRMRGVIGFSGTATEYHEELEQLGLRLVYVVPMLDLVASGYVAPFSEFGVPFAYSERERAILDLLEAYKELARNFMVIAGHDRLRRQFAEVPMETRVAIARNVLGMYAGRSDRAEAIKSRLAKWETGQEISLNETGLCIILQLATRKSDSELIPTAAKAEFKELIATANTIRQQLQNKLILPRFENYVAISGFGQKLDFSAVTDVLAQNAIGTHEQRLIKNFTAGTVIGLYDGLSDWSRYTGEGRVASIKAVIEAEKKTRKLSGIIVFDRGKRLRWRDEEILMPGYEGVGGLFAQIIGHSNLVPLAALSDEMYLPKIADADLPEMITNYVQESLMREELGGAMCNLVMAGLGIGDELGRRIRHHFNDLMGAYTAQLLVTRSSAVGRFDREVLLPLRREFGHRRHGVSRDVTRRLRVRLSTRNPHFRSLLTTYFDYAGVVRTWRAAQPIEIIQAGGTRQSAYVVKMPGGRKKQLMYDLVARLLDDTAIPLNMVIVSSWARTGWNVIRPNVLIDATATRDVTAWQQLRGRAMRARRTWSNDCYELLTALLGKDLGEPDFDKTLPPDVRTTFTDLIGTIKSIKGKNERFTKLLSPIISKEELAEYSERGVSGFSSAQRLDFIVRMMIRYNKVTHIHELIKAIGSPAQLRYDRTSKRWTRNEAISAKHGDEIAVDLEAGTLATGDAHAPLIYAEDPRYDSPAQITAVVRQYLEGADPKIVAAWINAV